jgi:hypothetical protein
METGGLIVATSALGTRVNFLGIVFILYMDLPYMLRSPAEQARLAKKWILSLSSSKAR